MRRNLLGSLAVGMLVTGGVMHFAGSEHVALIAAFLRVGALLAVLWLAWPELLRIRNPAWIVGLACLALVVVFSPRMLKFVLPVLVVLALLAFFKPRRRP